VKLIYKFIFGALNGTIGVDLVKIFDADGNGKVSFKEIRNASLDKWINFLFSVAISIKAFW